MDDSKNKVDVDDSENEVRREVFFFICAVHSRKNLLLS